MSSSPFDNLPLLTKKQALDILKTPIDKLRLSSDYYKAVFHLAKYPSLETEEALLNLLQSTEKNNSVTLAKRKAIEVLARLNCKKSIPAIKQFLKSNDPYLVETSAWALQELDLFDNQVNEYIGNLLINPIQNVRVLIQSLSKMNAISQLPKIEEILANNSLPPSIRGSAIAAIANLSGSYENINELKKFLSLANQNDRQSAVQDIIDAKAISLLPDVVITPISPSFRIRAINMLWTDSFQPNKYFSLFQLIEVVLLDDPMKINVLSKSDNNLPLKSLIRKLFSTDFSECYLALKLLSGNSFKEIWPILDNSWESFEKDYGALYFLVLLLRELKGFDAKVKDKFVRVLLFCLSDRWSSYMKFRPAAIISLIQLDYRVCQKTIPNWLDENHEQNWLCRYAALFCLENYCEPNDYENHLDSINACMKDSHRFVRYKAIDLISNRSNN